MIRGYRERAKIQEAQLERERDAYTERRHRIKRDAEGSGDESEGLAGGSEQGAIRRRRPYRERCARVVEWGLAGVSW